MNDTKTQQFKQTPLNALHKELQARMVPFAGYEMPVQYADGIKAEHAHTRIKAGLFDISHMGQIRISGENTAEQLEALVPGEIQSLAVNRQRYTVFTNEKGGILDDLMVSRLADSYFLVVNAACKSADYDYLVEALGDNNDVVLLEHKALLALQGPMAVTVLAAHAPDIADLAFLSAGDFTISGIECLIHRCGYTGEDGFELSVAADKAEQLARTLLKEPLVRPIGLGARDTLRLEAGLCLYGHDLDASISPVEADLSWIIAGKYRSKEPVRARFPGADVILNQLRSGPPRLRMGFKLEGRAPVREGAVIYNGKGKKVGIITSGGYGPTVAEPIAMGYVDSRELENGSFAVEIRKQTYNLSPIKLPFVKHKYFKKTK